MIEVTVDCVPVTRSCKSRVSKVLGRAYQRPIARCSRTNILSLQMLIKLLSAHFRGGDT